MKKKIYFSIIAVVAVAAIAIVSTTTFENPDIVCLRRSASSAGNSLPQIAQTSLYGRQVNGETVPGHSLQAKKPRHGINIDSLKHSSWFSIITKQIEAEEYELIIDKKRKSLLFTEQKAESSVQILQKRLLSQAINDEDTAI